MIKIFKSANEKIQEISSFYGKLAIFTSEFVALFLIFINVFRKAGETVNTTYSSVLYACLYLITLILIGFCILKVYFIMVSKTETPRSLELFHNVSVSLFFPLIIAMVLSFAFSNHALAIAVFLFLASLASTITQNLFTKTNKKSVR